jgi:RimJ/RimL family protein N-acetyltransferase
LKTEKEDTVIAFLTGEKIYLREIKPSDVSETSNYYRWLNDPEVTRYYQPYGIFPLSVEKLLERVTGAIKNPDIVPLAIMLPADGEEPVHIGAIQLGPINWLNRFAEIGYSVDRPYWGKGYGTEAVKLMRDYAFNKLNLHKLTAGAYAVNKGSIRILEKAGFIFEGTRTSMILLDGVYTDTVLLGMINPNHVAGSG